MPAPGTTAFALPEEDGSSKWASKQLGPLRQLTATGRPLLSNDPHRTVDKIPSLRYIVHLVAPGWDVIGATEPGTPGVQDGHNIRVAWGWTIFGMDQQDLYLETIHPGDAQRYKTETVFEQLQVQDSTFHVKGQADVTVQLKFTRHGPVLWEDPATHRALALRWVGAEPGTAGYMASLTLDRVRNWNEFEEAVSAGNYRRTILFMPTSMATSASTPSAWPPFAQILPAPCRCPALADTSGPAGFLWRNCRISSIRKRVLWSPPTSA